MARHLLVLGQTESGKTLYTRALTHQLHGRGVSSIIFDPKAHGKGWNLRGWRGLVFSDFPAYVDAFWASRSCFAVVDEAGDAFMEYRDLAIPLLTRGRDFDPRGGGGHTVCMIAQRAVLMNKTARSQAGQLVLFNVHRDDAEDLAADWNAPALLDAQALPQFHYLALVRFGQVSRGVVQLPAK